MSPEFSERKYFKNGTSIPKLKHYETSNHERALETWLSEYCCAQYREDLRLVVGYQTLMHKEAASEH